MAELLRQFEVDEDKMQVLAQCMDAYGVGGPDAEWPNNMISRHAVVYGNGAIARRGEPVIFATDPDELALCERLSAEAKAIVGEAEVGLGSESGDPFHPFFIAADEAIARPVKIDEALIRSRFGSTIFPPATIEAEPLREGAEWWKQVLDDVDQMEQEGEDNTDGLLPWLTLFKWFRAQPEFVDTALVLIGEYGHLSALGQDEMPPGTEMAGSVLPRLALGLTRGGSLCGLFGWSVQT